MAAHAPDILIGRREYETVFTGCTPQGIEWVMQTLASDVQFLTDMERHRYIQQIQRAGLVVEITK